MLRWYFIFKICLLAIVAVVWSNLDANGQLLLALLFLADFSVIPIIYLLVSFLRKKKLRPGEYAVKPEGKRI